MGLAEVLGLINIEPYRISIGDSYNTVIGIVGINKSFNCFYDEKHRLRVVKCDDIELSFIDSKLTRYSYIYIDDENNVPLEKIVNKNELIQYSDFDNEDFFTIKNFSGFDLVFDRASNKLHKIVVYASLLI